MNHSTKIYHAFAISTIARLILVCTRDSNKPNEECGAYRKYVPLVGVQPPADVLEIENTWLERLTTAQNLWSRLQLYWELLSTKTRENRERQRQRRRAFNNESKLLQNLCPMA